MGKRSTPPLTPVEVIAILLSLGFVFKSQEGSHRHFEYSADALYKRSIVTVDMACKEFDDYLMKSMIRQSNRTREQFYGATKRSARKASVPFLKIGVTHEPEAD